MIVPPPRAPGARVVLGFIVAAVVLGRSAGAGAAAPGADDCAKVYEEAQQLMRSGALLQSRADLNACQSACPKSLSKDCVTWRTEIDHQIPSLQISAKEADGSDPGKVRVTIDGALLTEVLTTTPIEVDPGKHVLVFEASTLERVEVSVEVPVGKKGFAVDVQFPAHPTPTPTASSPASGDAPRPIPTAPLTPRSRGPLVVGGFGVAGLAVGTALGIKGQVDRSHLRGTCAPTCARADVDAISREWTAGAVVAAVGGVAVGAAVAWWLLDARAGERSAAIAILPGPRSINIAGRF